MAETISVPTFSINWSANISSTIGTLTTTNTIASGANLSNAVQFTTVTGVYCAYPSTGTGTISTINLATLVDANNVSCGFVHIGAILVQNPTPIGGTVTLTLSAPANGFVGGQLITTGITCGQAIPPQAWGIIQDAGACSMAFPGGTGTLVQVTTNAGLTAISFPIIVAGKNS